MATLNELNNMLKVSANQIDFADIEKDANDLIRQYLMNNLTNIGNSAGQVIEGFKSITQEITHNGQLIDGTSIALIMDPPNIDGAVNDVNFNYPYSLSNFTRGYSEDVTCNPTIEPNNVSGSAANVAGATAGVTLRTAFLNRMVVSGSMVGVSNALSRLDTRIGPLQDLSDIGLSGDGWGTVVANMTPTNVSDGQRTAIIEAVSSIANAQVPQRPATKEQIDHIERSVPFTEGTVVAGAGATSTLEKEIPVYTNTNETNTVTRAVDKPIIQEPNATQLSKPGITRRFTNEPGEVVSIPYAAPAGLLFVGAFTVKPVAGTEDVVRTVWVSNIAGGPPISETAREVSGGYVVLPFTMSDPLSLKFFRLPSEQTVYLNISANADFPVDCYVEIITNGQATVDGDTVATLLPNEKVFY